VGEDEILEGVGDQWRVGLQELHNCDWVIVRVWMGRPCLFLLQGLSQQPHQSIITIPTN
jgi:hypothetical protein